MAKDTGTAEAKKPELDDDVAYVGAAPKNDAPEQKKDVTAEQPVFQQNPTAVAEEEAKAKKKKDEDLGIPPQDAATAAVQEKKEDKPQKPEQNQQVYIAPDTYVPGISRANMELLNDAWGIAQVTRALDETLENASISHDKQSGKVKFKLANGHKIEWIPDHNGIKGFVGFPHTKKMDDLDAKMVVATLASQGRKEINLFGDRQSKEKMWLEAMRQGLQVTNFQPLPSDDPNSVYQKWLRESQELQTGAAADPRFPAQENAIKVPGEEVAEPAAEKPAEGKPAAATEKPAEDKPAAEAEKPAADAATVEKPAEEKPAAAAEKSAEDKPAVEAVKPAEEKPAAEAEKPVAEDKGLKSSFLAEKPAAEEKAPEKPAAEEVKAEAPAKDTPVVEEKAPATEKPAAEKPAVKSSFIGETTDKKDEAPAPKGPEMPKNESFEETLDRRIKQAKNPEIEAALRTLKADYKSGVLKLDDFDRKVIQEKLGGNKPLTAAKVNAALGYAAQKPENKDVVLPKVAEEQKHEGPKRRPKGQTLG